MQLSLRRSALGFLGFVFVALQVSAQEPLNILIHAEDRVDTATHLRMYASSAPAPETSVMYSTVVTATSPSPLGSQNGLGPGLVFLVVPETAEVDYRRIQVFGATTTESEVYTEYEPHDEATVQWFQFLERIASEIPVLACVMDVASFYDGELANARRYVDRNEYDIVSVEWNVPASERWQKVQVDVPILHGQDTEIGLYAYWQSAAGQSSAAGQIQARDNLVDVGFALLSRRSAILAQLVTNGTFTMGSTVGHGDEEPVHQVTITYDVFIGKREVTVAEFREFVEAVGYVTRAERGSGAYVYADGSWGKKADATWQNPYFEVADDHPVVCVSWYDAVAYCNWLSKREGLRAAYRVLGDVVEWDTSANGYRLPTEAEWEFSARGGTASRGYAYSGAGDAGRLSESANFADKNTSYGWSDKSQDDGYPHAAPVETYRANELGLHDMSGNVWEWCWDWYGSDYYAKSAANDPTGPTSGVFRVLRGGSWDSYAYSLRVAHRSGDAPSDSFYDVGFRVARTAE